MKLSHLLLILTQVILVSFLAAGRVRCEHMPTVFVLETSDSDSPAISSSNGESSTLSSSSAKSSPQDDMLSKTEIITDEAATSNVKQVVVANNTIARSTAHSDQSESKQQSNQKQNNHQRHQQSNKTNNSSEGDDDDHHQVSSKTDQNKPKSEHQNDASKRDHDDHHSVTDHASSSTAESVQNDEAPAAARHRDNSAARRSLDSESQLAPARDKAIIAGGQPPNHPGGPHHHGPPPHHEPPHHHDHPHPPHHHDHPPPPPPHHKEHPPHHDDHPPHNSNERRDQTPHPTNSPSQRSKSGVTTTSTTTASSYQDQDQPPKTEERLLISITSDDDESYPRPPKQAGGPAGSQIGGYNDEPGPHQQQPHHHQKRKPAITISIQDQGRINTQNGGPGHQAVILRPTEDGIVIATLGGNNNNNNNNNKLKPSGGGGGGGLLSGLLGAVSAINQQHGTGHSINNNNEPYQEPANNPIRPISTTRSPIINEPYNNNNGNNNREPIGPGSRPQQPWTDERPQKPTFDEAAANSDPTRRPTSRPTFQDTPSGPSSNQQQDYENTGGGNGGGAPLAEQTGPKYPLNERNCGIMHETRIVGGDEADPDDFMWMAAIIKSKPRDGEPRPFCGGSLITRRHILTAAHCLEGLAPRDVLVRLGGYDFDDSASSSSADFAIDQFRVPAQYSKKTHVADIAIMRLKTPLSPNDNYKTVCMPQPRRSYVGALGTVTGYGSQSQTFRRAAPKLRQVTVPIWENRKCSAVYKKNLTESFMCAGYEEGGKDACQGDSGGPLMTEGPEQKMMIVGVVSHGIGCGAPGYPGVYTRTSTFVDWIEKNTRE